MCGEVGLVYHLRLCIHQHSFAEKREGLSVSDPISSRTEFLSSTEYPRQWRTVRESSSIYLASRYVWSDAGLPTDSPARSVRVRTTDAVRRDIYLRLPDGVAPTNARYGPRRR